MTLKTPRDFLRDGDLAGLLAYRRQLHGSITMTAPTEPATGDNNAVTIPVAPAPKPGPPVTQQVSFDPNDPAVQQLVIAAVEKARQEEKDKLYPTLNELRDKQKAFDDDLKARQKAEEDARKAAEDAEEEKRQAELSFAEKLAETENRFGEQLAALQRQNAERDAIIAKEREYSELQQYRSQQLAENAEHIMPDLVDFVQGNTTAEIDIAISRARDKSASILNSIASAQQQQMQSARGVQVTQPPAGPLDTDSGYQTFTSADIAGMSMADYAKHREGLLGSAGSQPPQGRGLLG